MGNFVMDSVTRNLFHKRRGAVEPKAQDDQDDSRTERYLYYFIVILSFLSFFFYVHQHFIVQSVKLEP